MTSWKSFGVRVMPIETINIASAAVKYLRTSENIQIRRFEEG
jgi:hypothetical protein